MDKQMDRLTDFNGMIHNVTDLRAKMRKTACNEAGRNKQKVEADKKEMKKKK